MVFAPSAGIPRPACMSTTARRSWASAMRSRTAGSSMPKASARGCSLIPAAPASMQRRASASAPSARGCTRHSAVSVPRDAAAAASTASLAAV